MALVTGVAEYHVRVMAGMAESLAEHDVPLLVVTNEPFASEPTPSIILDLIRRQVPCGVIALADTAHFRRQELPEALDAARMPTVTLSTKYPGAPRIVSDNRAGMIALLDHILDERGARCVALVRGVPGHIDSEEREAVYREALQARGIGVDEQLIVTGAFRPNASFEAVRALLRQRPDVEAIVALNDSSAFGTLAAVTHHGLRVPEDVLVSGFDNTDGSRLTWPALTTVDQDLEEQGRRAVDYVLRMAAGEPPPDDVVVPSQLVVRASTTTDQNAVLESADPSRLEGIPGVRMVDGVPTMALPLLAGQVRELGSTTRTLQARVALQDAAVNLSWTTSNCRTMDDVITQLDPCLSRLGVTRCFLAIDHYPPDGADPPCEHPTQLVLSYRDGRPEPVPDVVFPRHELLPAPLRAELERGVLLLQALSVGGRERGYLLFEPVPQAHLITEALRIDLPRTIDMVLSSRELTDRAEFLEHLVVQRTRELAQANAELRTFVMRDGLTGIANRMAFQQYLEEFSRGAEPGSDDVPPPEPPAAAEDTPLGEGRDLAVMMIDVDVFKAFNDRYGHLAGDDALKSVASCLTRSMRTPHDLACRYGGEEFAVVLRGASLHTAMSVAKRFQHLLAQTAIRHEASPVAPVVTASVGIATRRVSTGFDPTQMIEAADQALYQAKLRGRNRIVVAGRDREAAAGRAVV